MEQNQDKYADRRETYKQTRRSTLQQKNKDWKTAVSKQNFEGRNLDFLYRIMQNLALNRAEFARLLGCSQQALNYWFANDDIRLSKLESLFKHAGYQIKCELTVRENSDLNIGKQTFDDRQEMKKIECISEKGNVEDYTIIMPVSTNKSKPKTRKALNAINEDSRMYFLTRILQERGINLLNFCRSFNLNYKSIYTFLKSDDMLVATLLDIAKKAKISVTWKLLPTAHTERPEQEPQET